MSNRNAPVASSDGRMKALILEFKANAESQPASGGNHAVQQNQDNKDCFVLVKPQENGWQTATFACIGSSSITTSYLHQVKLADGKSYFLQAGEVSNQGDYWFGKYFVKLFDRTGEVVAYMHEAEIDSPTDPEACRGKLIEVTHDFNCLDRLQHALRITLGRTIDACDMQGFPNPGGP